MAPGRCAVCVMWVGEEVGRALTRPHTAWEAPRGLGLRERRGSVGWDLHLYLRRAAQIPGVFQAFHHITLVYLSLVFHTI